MGDFLWHRKFAPGDIFTGKTFYCDTGFQGLTEKRIIEASVGRITSRRIAQRLNVNVLQSRPNVIFL